MNFKTRKVDLHIIDALESTSAISGRSEALAIRYRLRDTPISIVSHYAWDRRTLDSAINSVSLYRREYVNPRKFLPIVHIACHGNPDGLMIGDDQPIPWSSLLQALLPLQRKLDYTLPISLSSCHGYYGYRVALQGMEEYEKRRPYYALIGPKARLSTEELISSFSSLYRGLLAEYRGLPASVDLANTHIKKTEAYMDYTYGTDVSQKFSAHGVDDAKLFSKPPRKSLC